MGTEERQAQRSSGIIGTDSKEEKWAQGNGGHRRIGHRGTVTREEQWEQRNSRCRGTLGTEEKWEQRNSGHSSSG